MSIVTYPLDNIEYSAKDAELFHYGRTSGIFAGEDFSLSVSGSDNFVSVAPGVGWIVNSRFAGKVIGSESVENVNMGLPDAAQPRIDAVVLRFDLNKNGTEFVAKQGRASATPLPPEVERTGTVFELHLAHVYRRAGATAISYADLTDLRTNPQYCGIVSSEISGYALSVLGGEMQGDIAMAGHKVTGLPDPVDSADAVTKNYADKIARSLISMGAKIESWESLVAYNKPVEHEFSGNVQAVIVGLQLQSGGAIISAIWTENMSGIQQNCYGRLGNTASDTWKTTVTITGNKVKISRDATTTLRYYVSAILADVSTSGVVDDGNGNVTVL